MSRKYEHAHFILDIIATLEDNWNDNGAKAFSKELIERCRVIVEQLPKQPFIAPTACGSIQMEYTKYNGEYLEFNVFEDKIEVFIVDDVDAEREFELKGESQINEMCKLINEFHEK